ncbi:unnamed protein product [Urochloa decumbens]|uniref:Uncharacterized protein n=1 Tax=Urochloa decumbens TaxID=240449 RepID=A0ABC9GAH4_9POAL
MAGGGVHGARDGGEQPRERRRRVLVFPLPFQGHIDPMMHLAGVLHDRGGLAITVLHTRFNALDPARHPEFRFVPVPDGVPADVAAAGRIIDVILAMNAAMEASPAAVRDALASALAEDGEDNGAACLVIDANLLAVQRVAREIGLITVVLRTGSAACLSADVSADVIVFLLHPPHPGRPHPGRPPPVPGGAPAAVPRRPSSTAAPPAGRGPHTPAPNPKPAPPPRPCPGPTALHRRPAGGARAATPRRPRARSLRRAGLPPPAFPYIQELRPIEELRQPRIPKAAGLHRRPLRPLRPPPAAAAAIAAELSLPQSQLYMPVPELPPLRVRDLFQTKISSHEMLCKVIARINETLRNSSGVVTNTFEALEPAELEKLRGELNLPFLLAAGPLHKLSSKKTTGSSLLDQDYGCIEWLDTQASGSVLYVSFGSLAAMDSGEFMEVAWGLANSGHPFLWVVRPKLVQDCDSVALPEGFEDVIKGRGMVIQWAPQQEVLAHRAVGGFWTHSGWNSTLESVSEGVPMICRPNAVDQMMNARYVENVWGVGFELEGELERGKIENAVRRLMDEREGAEIRERAKVLRRKVAECLDSSGSSQIAVDKFVSYILSL